MHLADEMRPHIAPNLDSPNHRALSTEKKLAITLYYLKDMGSLDMAANTFGIALNTVDSVVFQGKLQPESQVLVHRFLFVYPD